MVDISEGIFDIASGEEMVEVDAALLEGMREVDAAVEALDK